MGNHRQLGTVKHSILSMDRCHWNVAISLHFLKFGITRLVHVFLRWHILRYVLSSYTKHISLFSAGQSVW